MTADPSRLRTIVAFALDVAYELGISANGIHAHDRGDVTVNAWDLGADNLDEIADRSGWPSEAIPGFGWRGRRRTFHVDGRSVRITIITRTTPTEVTE